MREAPGGPPTAAVVVFLAVLALERVGELALSARNAARLRARGGVERARGHFPLFVVLHTLVPAALVAEVLLLGARPPATWPLFLAAYLAAEALRVWAIVALGDRWNVRVWVVPGEPLVARGPFRWLRHPNYLAVAVQLAAGPLVFGAWRTAVAASVANALALAVRIPKEERALELRP